MDAPVLFWFFFAIVYAVLVVSALAVVGANRSAEKKHR